MFPQHRNLTVLTIDDDADMRRSIVSYLEDVGFTVYQASGGRQGLEMFEVNRPDLVFTDLMMPEVDGLAVVKEITRVSRETPVVVISGNGSVSYAIEAVRQGAWDYITKPILEFSVIDEVIRQVLERAESMRVERSYQESLKKAVLSQQRQITVIETTDPLTRLPVRPQMQEKFSQVILNSGFSGDLFVLLLELENFKTVTELFGHDARQALLTEVAARLKTLVRRDVWVYRSGADQFAVLAANDPDVQSCIKATLSLLDEPVKVQGQEVDASYSMGIATFPYDGESMETLLQHADIARANARISGRNRYFFYSRELWDQVQDRVALEVGLRRALARREYELHYQPKVDAASGTMLGVEALLRWRPSRSEKLVSPAVFIPVLEQSGLIVEVGAWALSAACRQHAEWRKRGMGPVTLAVNVAAAHFETGELPRLVERVLHETGMEPGLLCLELTESTLVQETETVVATLHELRRLGVKLAIDDFGTGYSSLAYLKDLPIDELKIDRSFVEHLPGDQSTLTIVSSLLELAAKMRLGVVAEGVENAEQAEVLASLGCRELQGFLFSPPLPHEELMLWWRAREAEPARGAAWGEEKIGELAGGIAHDFKNIITGIVGNLTLAQIHLEENHESAEPLRRVAQASLRATELAQKLMELSKPGAVRRKAVPVRAAVEECIALTLAGSDTRCEVDVAGDVADLYMDQGEFFQILNNLVLNAAQALSPQGNITVAAENEAAGAVSAGTPRVRLTVRDDGCGMSAEVLEKALLPYFTTKPAGNGLGLASTKTLVDRNGGVLNIESAPGRGTCVELLLPACPGGETASTAVNR
ncbi:EAL domain-containing protein [Geomonas agri]|uniref:EAL domain-containing protein n=1 Tax=Geomonas agri TaxID=2873702 RepID=UPI001CD19B54|nr:EAL domain-containing protein [Geomonas agri]